ATTYTTAAAAIAPMTCARMEPIASVVSVRLSSTAATVTAGLKCPPEMCPTAKIAASRPRGKANGTTTSVETPAAAAAGTDEYPIVRKRNVATNSATYLRVSITPPWITPSPSPSTGDTMLTARSSPGGVTPVPSAGARTPAARTQPRLPRPAHVPGRLRARRCRQLHRPPPARPGADGIGSVDGCGRGALDPARSLLRHDRRCARRSERPQADDVP